MAVALLLCLSLLSLSLSFGGVGKASDDAAPTIDAGESLVAVVIFKPSTAATAAQQRDELQTAQFDVIAALPEGTVGALHRFENLPAIAVEVADRGVIELLRADPRVARVDIDVAGRAMLADVVTVVGADLMQLSGYDGSGVTIAVIDTGVDSFHPDLVSSVLDHQVCFGYDGGPSGVGYCPDGTDAQIGSRVDVPAPASDTDGHGTHVAGIITSDGLVAPTGVAPRAEILAIKALDDGARFSSFMFNIVAALDYLISHPELGVDIVNMSLGTSGEFVGNCDSATAFTMAGAAAVNALVAQGVTIIASAGGSGSGTSMPAPACLSGVIAVGASDDNDLVADVSNANAVTDLFAPGVDVVSTEPGGSGARTGTSMAAAVASGCAALFIEAGYDGQPGQLRSRMTTSAVRVVDPTNGLSFPRIDCFAAPVVGAPPPPPPEPTPVPQLEGPTITNPPPNVVGGPLGFGAIQPDLPEVAQAPVAGAAVASTDDSPGSAQSIALTGSNHLAATAGAFALIALGGQVLIIRRRLLAPHHPSTAPRP